VRDHNHNQNAQLIRSAPSIALKLRCATTTRCSPITSVA
jgi:hypothetical protein